MCGRYALGISIDNLPQKFNETVLNPNNDHNSLSRLELENTSGSSNETHYETSASINGESQSIQLNLSSPDFQTSYNIPPTSTGVIIYMEKPDTSSGKKHDLSYHIEASKFGVLPIWAKPQDASRVNKSGGSSQGKEYSREIQQQQAKLFNCRKETLQHPQTVWATPRKHSRCVVPISGYFEWLNTKQGKIPHFIHSPKKPLLFLAGLYSHNVNYNDTEVVPENAKYFSSFSIVTGPAEGKGKNDMRWLHSRKPIFIEPNSKAWYEWLNPDDQWDEQKVEFCLDTDTNPVFDNLEWHVVGRSVGNPANKGPEVIAEEKKKQSSISSFFSKREDPKKEGGVKKEEKEIKSESSSQSGPQKRERGEDRDDGGHRKSLKKE